MANVLVFGCVHSPFIKDGYIDFLNDTRKKFKCDTFVNLGDEMDNHSISNWDPEPDSKGANEEFDNGLKKLKPLYKLFPKSLICLSNHSSRPYRQAAKVRLNSRYLRSYKEFMKAPRGWRWKDKHIINNVIYQHGDNYSGNTPHMQAAIDNRMSTVQAHCHTVAGVQYIAGPNDRIFGMSTGCGADTKSYAFRYGIKNRKKAVLACGVVIDGRYAFVIPMELGSKIKYL